MANPYFNAEYYLTSNPDVFAAGYTPETAEQHYLQYGATEAFLGDNADRKPAPWFDIQYYFAENPDLLANGVTPATAFHHFTTYGIAEGRSPAPGIELNADNLGAYAAANPDLTEAFGIDDTDNLTPEQVTALAQHYYQYGYNEDRPALPADLNPAPEGITLTTGADVGGEFDQSDSDAGVIFNAPLDRSEGSFISQQTLNSDDIIIGSTGEDTLNAVLNGVDSLTGNDNPTIEGVETYNLTVGSGNYGELNLENASGYETLNNVNSRGDLYLGEVSAADGAPTLGLENVRGDTVVNYDGDTPEIAEQNVIANTVGRDINDTVESAELSISGADIETLNLSVENGVYLDLEGDAGNIENLNISGSGAAVIANSGNFGNLVSLDSSDYNDGLDIDVSGADELEAVTTGAGDDGVVISAAAVDGDLVVDMGEGDDTLTVINAGDAAAINGLTFLGDADQEQDGSVSNVETLELRAAITLSGVATLDLNGFDDALETIQLSGDFDGGGNDLTIAGAPEALTINAEAGLRDLDLHADDVADLTLNVNDADTNALISGLSGANLQNLAINHGDLEDTEDAAGSVLVNLSSDFIPGTPEETDPDTGTVITAAVPATGHNLSALESVVVNAAGQAGVLLNGTDVNADFNALTNASVTAANGDAGLAIVGNYSLLEEALEDANEGLVIAQDALTTAEGELNTAIGDLAIANNDLADAQTALDDANDVLTAAEAALGAANGVFTAAVATQADAVAAAADAQTAQADAVAAAADAQTALDVATTSVSAGDFETFLLANFATGGALTAGARGSQNQAELWNEIDNITDPGWTFAFKAAFKATVPGGSGFAYTADRDAWLASATPLLNEHFDIDALTGARDDADAAVLAADAAVVAADAAVVAADAAVVAAGADVDAAVIVRDAALADVNNAQGIVDDLTDNVIPAAELALSDALEAVTEAEGEVAEAAAAAAAALADLENAENFSGLETITVTAEDGSAGAAIIDAEGNFTLDVTASEAAGVVLINTGATQVNIAVDASEEEGTLNSAWLYVGGVNDDLETITIAADTATILLDDSLESFTTLDLTGVGSEFDVDASFAEFTNVVTYQIGSADGSIEAADTREVFKFNNEVTTDEGVISVEIGDVTIDGFTAGGDANSDRIDLSDFGWASTDLNWTENGDDLTISDGEFNITLTGVLFDHTVSDVLDFNVIL